METSKHKRRPSLSPLGPRSLSLSMGFGLGLWLLAIHIVHNMMVYILVYTQKIRTFFVTCFNYNFLFVISPNFSIQIIEKKTKSN